MSKNNKIIIYIHSLSNGGAERVTANLSQYWVNQGHDVIVVTNTDIKDDFYRLDPKVKRIALNLDGISNNIITAIKSNLYRMWVIRRIIKCERPDIVLSMMTTANVVAALATVGLPCAVVGSERNHPPRLPLGRIWETLRRWTYGLLDAVVALTNESADWLRIHTTAKRIEIIPNAIMWPLPKNPPIIEPDSILRENRNFVLAVGRLVSQKGFDMLLEAFSMVARERPDWDLVILGEGAERSTLEKLVKEKNISGRVFLPGRAGNVVDWYNRAQLYVLSSRFEGFPNTLIEAMAAGCPVISFDCDTGPRNIIRHEVDGLLVPANDVRALAYGMARMMDDEEFRKRCASKAIEVRRRFSIQHIGDMWDKLFDEVIH